MPERSTEQTGPLTTLLAALLLPASLRAEFASAATTASNLVPPDPRPVIDNIEREQSFLQHPSWRTRKGLKFSEVGADHTPQIIPPCNFYIPNKAETAAT